jgi:HupE / UreJ protein
VWHSLTIVCFMVVTCAGGRAAHAHGMRSAYLEIDEVVPGEPTVRLRVTRPELRVMPRIEHCELAPLAAEGESEDGLVRAYRAHCTGSLVGATIEVSGLGAEIEEAVVWIRTERQEIHTAVLTASSNRMVVPAHTSPAATFFQYAVLGLRHILGGADHLLFLLLIVIQLRHLRAIVLAETAFSLSHGLAFAATSTGWIEITPAPVEACIALSLLLLALDAGRSAGPGARSTALLALVFGAVHGLGFAGGLRELGVPQDQLAPAILGFGAGVELGQVGFVVCAWGALAGLRKFRVSDGVLAWIVLGAGVLATSWLFERGLAALEGT